MVGQVNGRRAASIIIEMIKEGKFRGRVVLIVGQKRTGKTTIVVGMTKSIGLNTPFQKISASDMTSLEMVKSSFGVAVDGVLLIKNVHMLHTEAFNFLLKAVVDGHGSSPTLVMGTDKARAPIRGLGVDSVSNHGIPMSLLQHATINGTLPYKTEERKTIIEMRCNEKGIQMKDDAKNRLATIGESHSLSYACQLIEFAAALASQKQKQGGVVVEVEDVKGARGLFASTLT